MPTTSHWPSSLCHAVHLVQLTLVAGESCISLALFLGRLSTRSRGPRPPFLPPRCTASSLLLLLSLLSSHPRPEAVWFNTLKLLRSSSWPFLSLSSSTPLVVFGSSFNRTAIFQIRAYFGVLLLEFKVKGQIVHSNYSAPHE